MIVAAFHLLWYTWVHARLLTVAVNQASVIAVSAMV